MIIKFYIFLLHDMCLMLLFAEIVEKCFSEDNQ